MRGLTRWLLRATGVVVGLVLISLFLAWQMLRGSLPILDGTVSVAAITRPASIERDHAGIVTIGASNRRDLAFATGYAHGQDRYFQMDLSRRSAAGELAALVGSVALPRDRLARLHRFRSRAELALAGVNGEQLGLLEAYTAGVNSALDAMSTRPFEYVVLRSKPQPWRVEDCLLVLYAMFLDLNDARADRDIEMSLVEQAVAAEVFAWLYPSGSRWDAPLVGAARIDAPVPGPESYDLRGYRPQRLAMRRHLPEQLPGSNNWAVGGQITRDGRAIVANDMHLGLRAPAIFYRARFVIDGPDPLDISGVTLPGTPVMVVGSNGKLAWGFTNSNGDWSDAIVVRPGSTVDVYRTASGELPFVVHRERIEVRDGPAEEFNVRETIWGPIRADVVHPDGEIAVSWTAHELQAVNFELLGMETAGSVEEGLAIANRVGIPPQNFMAGDADGNIGWTIAGQVPLRGGYDGRLPADGATGGGFSGWLPEEQYPRVVNPDDGRLWTANSRVVDGDELARLGDGGYALGARAMQIRDDLRALERFSAIDMLPIHLDDRALFLQRWRDLLLSLLDADALASKPERALYRELVNGWMPRAATESVGYRLVREFRDEVYDRVFEMLMTPVRARYPHEVVLRPSRQFEAPLWSLVSERPAHMLTANWRSWRELLLAAVDSNIRAYGTLRGGLAQRRWGEQNTAAIRHPLSGALPWAARWLDMPRDELPGDRDLPRVQGPAFGASERFAVAPGAEAEGYMQMPTGQSGHPLSPFYQRGHSDWVQGRPSPFLPGVTQYRLLLQPE